MMLATWLKTGVAPWQGSPGHFIVYQSNRVNVFIGYMGAGSTTATHAHFHDMVGILVSDLGAATETIECKETGSVQTRSISSLAPGYILTNLPPAPGVPYVHRIEVNEGDATFIAVDSFLRPLPRDVLVPSIVITGQGMSHAHIRARSNTHFYSSVEFVVPAGETIDAKAGVNVSADTRGERDSVRDDSRHEDIVLEADHILVVRIICALQSNNNKLVIDNRPQGKLQHIDRQYGSVKISAHFVTDFPNQPEALQTRIQNSDTKHWHGVILDVYGGTFSQN